MQLSRNKDSKSAVIKVNDNGKGLPPEAIKNLFKRFYEGDYRKFNTIGTGIGLSLTKDLVKLHKGKIAATSIINQGTIFSVTIPVDKEAYQDQETDNIQIIIPDATTAIFKEKKKTPALLKKRVWNTSKRIPGTNRVREDQRLLLTIPLINFSDSFIYFNPVLPTQCMQFRHIRQFFHRPVGPGSIKSQFAFISGCRNY